MVPVYRLFETLLFLREVWTISLALHSEIYRRYQVPNVPVTDLTGTRAGCDLGHSCLFFFPPPAIPGVRACARLT